MSQHGFVAQATMTYQARTATFLSLALIPVAVKAHTAAAVAEGDISPMRALGGGPDTMVQDLRAFRDSMGQPASAPVDL